MYQPQDLAIYIHWPFCKSKCPYCDFYKEISKNENQDEIIAQYLNDLQFYYDLTAERKIKSVFFGGGTPSLIKPQNVAKILDFIAKKWCVLPNAEISLEANPNSNYKNMFADLHNAGINRLSLGVQALNENDLRFLGRTHTLEQATDCLAEVVKVFANHSADLIYARPHQKIDEWQKELQQITGFGLKHLSLYQLTIEENTVFAKKNIQPLEEDNAVKMYEFTRDYLQEYGYNLYEVSNFAQAGYESKHNLTYWQGDDYLGIGKSAHGRLLLNGEHYATTYHLQQEKISPSERAEELIIMGLRLTKGINKKHFQEVCGLQFNKFVNQEKFVDLQENDLLKENDEYVFATRKGFSVLNKIIEELCC